MTEQQQTSSCFKYEVPLTPLEELKRGNRILLTLYDIKQEQIQKMADELFSSSSELSKPVFKRGVHINEASNQYQYAAEPFDFDDLIAQQEQEQQDQEDQEQQEEPDPDTKAQIQEYLLEQEQEQQQDDLVWSPFGQRMVTPKDFDTFEPKVEPIIKKEPVKQEPVKQEPVKQEPVKQEPVQQEPVKQEPVKQEPVKIKQNLFEKLLQKYKKKADKINEIIERQEAERQEEAARQQQEAQNTFYDFAELADCFEANDEEEEEEKQEEQKNTNSDPKRNWRKCAQLQEKLDLLPDRLSKPTDKRFLQEWQIMEQVWHEEHRRIIIEHTENCEFCQSTPPKKLRRCEECNTIEPIEPIEY